MIQHLAWIWCVNWHKPLIEYSGFFRHFNFHLIWATTLDFQQCGMCNQQSLTSACAYAQSDQSLFYSLAYSKTVKLLTEHNLEFLSFKGGCTGSSESTQVKYHIIGNHMSRLIFSCSFRWWTWEASHRDRWGPAEPERCSRAWNRFLCQQDKTANLLMYKLHRGYRMWRVSFFIMFITVQCLSKPYPHLWHKSYYILVAFYICGSAMYCFIKHKKALKRMQSYHIMTSRLGVE